MGAIPDRLDVELVGTSRPPVRGSSLPVAPSPLTRKALGPGCDAHDQAWGRGLQVDLGREKGKTGGNGDSENRRGFAPPGPADRTFGPSRRGASEPVSK